MAVGEERAEQMRAAQAGQPDFSRRCHSRFAGRCMRERSWRQNIGQRGRESRRVRAALNGIVNDDGFAAAHATYNTVAVSPAGRDPGLQACRASPKLASSWPAFEGWTANPDGTTLHMRAPSVIANRTKSGILELNHNTNMISCLVFWRCV